VDSKQIRLYVKIAMLDKRGESIFNRLFASVKSNKCNGLRGCHTARDQNSSSQCQGISAIRMKYYSLVFFYQKNELA